MGRGKGQVNSNQTFSSIRRSPANINLDPVFLQHQNDSIQAFKNLDHAEFDSLMIHLGKGKPSERNGRFLSKNDDFLQIIENDSAALNAVGLTPADIGIRLAETIEPYLN